MQIPWAIIISLGVLGLAYLIKHFVLEVIEEENIFLTIIAIFFVIYAIAAIAVGSLNPLHLTGGEAIASTGFLGSGD